MADEEKSFEKLNAESKALDELVQKSVISILNDPKRTLTERESLLIKSKTKQYNIFITSLAILTSGIVTLAVYTFTKTVENQYQEKLNSLESEAKLTQSEHLVKLDSSVDKRVNERKTEFKTLFEEVQSESKNLLFERAKYETQSEIIQEDIGSLASNRRRLLGLVDQLDSLTENIQADLQELNDKKERLDNIVASNSELLDLMEKSGAFVVKQSENAEFFQLGELKIQWGTSNTGSGTATIDFINEYTDEESIGISIIPVKLDWNAVAIPGRTSRKSMDITFKDVDFRGKISKRFLTNVPFKYIIVGK